MKTHMYFVRVSTYVFVQSLDGLNKEFCSVLFCSVLLTTFRAQTFCYVLISNIAKIVKEQYI